ncbi:HEPN domain-containing protein [Dolichospermum flos-aquae]|uniref:HEPN domain-containing protein n=1 Tax=Dolichospermum flos-aquae LEGE 04289 TaxID=1828708 RepID=A0ACC5Q0K8_DOLFA|nr:HEPN domain-containing protein [Dolichospermum flos-aquae]MBE9218098.1 HEPN domain-containing protein [Dolichospermum flos-aquae LEGE 04289]
MNFNWLSYLEVAKILVQEVNSSCKQETDLSLKEAKIRSSISRAYYSAFCLARNYLRDIENDSELQNLKTDVHKYVINKFLACENPELREIGEELGMLRRMRNLADYNDKASNNDYILFSNGNEALNLANNIITFLETLYH